MIQHLADMAIGAVMMFGLLVLMGLRRREG